MVFCPNCKSNYMENIEFCIKCGVRLVAENMRCPGCGVLIPSSTQKCINCGELIQKEVERNRIRELLDSISQIPRELKNFKWDSGFVMANLVIIVGIMGIVIITMLIMNYF